MSVACHTTKNERAAVLVEMAIAAPLLILLVFGILEFGLAFQDRLTVSNGTQSAGRVAAALGNNEDADIATLEAVEQSLGILPNAGGNVIKHVQIWKSNGSGAVLGGGCGSAGSGTANCNWYVYTPTVDPNVCDWTPCPDPSKPGWSYGGGFIPANRDVTLDDDGLDVVGVTVLFSHDWLTGVLPIGDVVCTSTGTNCWADTALFRLEPQNFGS